MVLEKTLENSLESKETKPVHLKGNQPQTFTGRTDAEAPILWPSDVKSQLIGKDPDSGNIEGKMRRGRERMRWLNSITGSMDMNLSILWEIVKGKEAWRAAVQGLIKSWT